MTEPMHDEVVGLLKRLQDFDVSTLARPDLGTTLNFEEVIPAAERLKGIYIRIPVSVVEDFPESALTQIKTRALADYALFDRVVKFVVEGDPKNVRSGIITEIKAAYTQAFQQLSPLISYAASKTTDFARLETSVRAAIQDVTDKGDELVKRLESQEAQANRILEEVRRVAEEQGVSQQAVYFKDEAKRHSDDATWWLRCTVCVAIGACVWAFGSLWLHKAKWLGLSPETPYEAAQLVAGKILIFAVITYMLYLSARNFMSSRHNAVVNTHRQNALLTYRALTESARTDDTRDIVLGQAAACIFAPQVTGFSSSGHDGVTAKSVVELLPKAMHASGA